MDLHWWSIEVRNSEFSAFLWRDVHSAALIEAAITNGAQEWDWVELSWGVVFEVAFVEPEAWQRFRDLPVVRASLDAVPDRLNGLYIYPGRGGHAGAGRPRRPRLPMGAGAAPLPEEPPPVVVTGHPEADFRPPTISVAA